jgi:hypothetical protein
MFELDTDELAGRIVAQGPLSARWLGDGLQDTRSPEISITERRHQIQRRVAEKIVFFGSD